jgi:predicted Zn-dependent peptidase
MGDIRAALLRDLEINSQQNGYVLDQLAYAYQFGEDLGVLFGGRALYDELTAEAVRNAARTYLNPNRYVKVTRVPEPK